MNNYILHFKIKHLSRKQKVNLNSMIFLFVFQLYLCLIMQGFGFLLSESSHQNLNKLSPF